PEPLHRPSDDEYYEPQPRSTSRSYTVALHQERHNPHLPYPHPITDDARDHDRERRDSARREYERPHDTGVENRGFGIRMDRIDLGERQDRLSADGAGRMVPIASEPSETTRREPLDYPERDTRSERKARDIQDLYGPRN